MKILTALLFVMLSFPEITPADSAENSLKNKSLITLHDTLPAIDTMGKNPIDTFGGIKNINDTNLKAKKDSLFK